MNKLGNISNNLIMILNNIERIRIEHFSEEVPIKFNKHYYTSDKHTHTHKHNFTTNN